jgi:hypothetical protein
MKIVQIESTKDDGAVSQFLQVAAGVYKNDSVWVPQSEDLFLKRFEDSLKSEKVKIWPFIAIENNSPVARGAAFLDRAAEDERGQPQGWIGFFEYFRDHEAAALKILDNCEQVLSESGAKSVLAVKSDNQLVGLLTNGFTMPQTIFTGYNPPYYLDTFLRHGYTVATGIRSLNFDADSVRKPDIKIRGFITREFNRRNLNEEIAVFNTLQNAIFADRNGYVSRTIDEDNEMVQSLIPFIDDELIIIAEDSDGNASGLLICLPDKYQVFKGEKQDRARLISIGVLPGWRYGGVGAMMISHLIKNLLKKGYRTAEASWILEGNVDPQNVARRFNAKPGREFVLLKKNL